MLPLIFALLFHSHVWAEAPSNDSLNLTLAMDVIKFDDKAIRGRIKDYGRGYTISFGYFGSDWLEIETPDQKVVTVWQQDYDKIYLQTKDTPTRELMTNASTRAIVKVKLLGTSLAFPGVGLGEIIEKRINTKSEELRAGRLITGQIENLSPCNREEQAQRCDWRAGRAANCACKGDEVVAGGGGTRYGRWTVESIFDTTDGRAYLVRNQKSLALIGGEDGEEDLITPLQTPTCDDASQSFCAGEVVYMSTASTTAGVPQEGEPVNVIRRGIVTRNFRDTVNVFVLEGYRKAGVQYVNRGHAHDKYSLVDPNASVQTWPNAKLYVSQGCNYRGLCVGQAVTYAGAGYRILAVPLAPNPKLDQPDSVILGRGLPGDTSDVAWFLADPKEITQ